MKTFSEFLEGISEAVDPPKSPDERRFVLKHPVKVVSHPVADDEIESAKTVKDRTREADKQPGEDKISYEEMEFRLVKESKLKLDDGNTVSISESDDAHIQKLFKGLSSENKKKMKSRMKESIEGFEEILSFAKEVG